jgi:hypothetical protein
MSSARLPAALVWQEGGHLTEEALTSLADDARIVPADAASHAFACEECARRLGEAALLSTVLGGSLALAMADAPATLVQKATTPSPVWALVVGIGFVGIGAVPFLLGLGAWLPREAMVLQRSVPVFAHGLLTLFAGLGGADALPRLLVSLVSLAVLMMAAFTMSRLTPREGVVQ